MPQEQPAPSGQRDISVSTIHHNAAFKFLDFLFEEINESYVEFRFFTAGRKPKLAGKPSYLDLPLDHERIINEVLSLNGQQMITVGVAPRCRIPERGGAGRDSDVIQVNCIWANLDNQKIRGGAVEVTRRIKALPLRPSIVVNSGYGHHVYFVFNSLLRAESLSDWSDLIRSLRAILHTDEQVILSQVMRLPGTLNIKENYSVSCEIWEEGSSWTRYSLEEVHEALDPTTLSIPLQGTSLSPNALRHHDLPQDLISAIITGHRAVSRGADSSNSVGEAGRDFWIASTLFDKGFGEEEIKAIFRAHPHGCGSKWAQKRDGENYLDSLLRRVIGRYLEAGGRPAAQRVWAEEEDLTESGLPPNYVLHDDGSLWFHPPVTDEGRKLPKLIKVCNSLMRITGIHENVDTGQITLIISFNYLGRTISIPVLRSQMSDPRQLAAALSGVGAPINYLNARFVTAYLAAYEHSFVETIPKKKVTSRFGRGRAGGPFFFPGLSSDIEFAPLGAGDASLYRAYASRRGSLQGWLKAMRMIADEALMIPQVAVLTSLVPPLQRRLQVPNFLLDIHGNTSTGKSTSLKLAASVYGKPHDPDSLILQWMNTSVAIEQVAAMCSESPVFLDDAQHCPAELKRSVIYMIANGRGKGRGARSGRGGLSETLTWHTVALSTSEEPLHESSPQEGARGRILSVGGLTPPFRPGMSLLIQEIERVITTNHGHAGEVYLRHLNGWTVNDTERWHRRYVEIRNELLRNSSSDLAGRVSGYIAAIQLAAEVTCPLLGLPFKADVIGAWLILHLEERQSEQNQVLLALRLLADYYIANINHFAGDGRYDPGRRLALFGISKDQQYVGFLRSAIEAAFKSRKWNVSAVLNKMAAAGALCVNERDRYTKKVRVEGVVHRMICVKWSAILPEDTHSPTSLFDPTLSTPNT